MEHKLFSKYEIGDTVYLSGPCDRLKCTILDISFYNGKFMYLLNNPSVYVGEIEIEKYGE